VVAIARDKVGRAIEVRMLAQHPLEEVLPRLLSIPSEVSVSSFSATTVWRGEARSCGLGISLRMTG